MKSKKCVKLFLCCALGWMLAPGGHAFAGKLEVTTESALDAYERDTQEEESVTLLPFSEYLGVNYESDIEGLSFHGYGWGRVNLGQDGYYEDEADGQFLYGYLEYRAAAYNARMMLGRYQMFSGVSNESVDGVSLQAPLGAIFDFSLYGGSPVSMTEDGRNGDSIVGGRLANFRPGLYELGVSYKLVRNDSSDYDEKAGVDLSLDLPYRVGVNGYSTWNLLTDGWAEHSYQMQIPVSTFQIRPFFQLFQYDDYFSDNEESPNPFKYLAGTGEELTTIGAELDWFGAESYEVNLKAKNIDYDLQDETSQYYSGMVIKHLEDMCQVGLELGVMVGDIPENKYQLGRAFVYWDKLPESMPLEFISSDLVFVNYDEDIYNQGSSTFFSLGAGRSFLDKALDMKFAVDYSRDPYFDNDFRAKLIAEYTFGKE